MLESHMWYGEMYGRVRNDVTNLHWAVKIDFFFKRV